MRIIDWNTRLLSKADGRMEYIRDQISIGESIVVLQEVEPSAIEGIRSMFDGIADVRYSLDHRPPGRYDGTGRKLGVAILVSSDMKVISSDVLHRALLPDRTLLVDVDTGHGMLRVMGLHSITGCSHGKAKDLQYHTFAECIDDLHPDIVTIDANEPEADAPTVDGMVFWCSGARIFFESLVSEGLVDSLVHYRDTVGHVSGECLEVSHITGKGKTRNPRRYDFIFLRPDRFGNGACNYDLELAERLRSDHAVVTVDTVLTGTECEVVDDGDIPGEYYPDYDPGIDGATWNALVSDHRVFTECSLRVLGLMMEMGGEATCMQMAERYGGDFRTYRNILTQLAVRVHRAIGCPRPVNSRGETRTWPVLFRGRPATDVEEGSTMWIVRDGLRSALESSRNPDMEDGSDDGCPSYDCSMEG